MLGAEAAQLLLHGRRVALPGEGIGALALEGEFPGAEAGLMHAEGAGGFGQGVTLRGDELDGSVLNSRV